MSKEKMYVIRKGKRAKQGEQHLLQKLIACGIDNLFRVRFGHDLSKKKSSKK